MCGLESLPASHDWISIIDGHIRMQYQSAKKIAAGGGIKNGFIHGETDELGFGPISGKCHVHDPQATVLHLLGLDHLRLTFRFQGRDYRLTDVHGKVISEILA